MRRTILYIIGLSLAMLSCTKKESITPFISITPEVLNFEADGGSQEVTIAANITYEISENADWLSCEKGSGKITIVVDISAENAPRSANILIWNLNYDIAKSIQVTQSAYTPPINTEGWVEMPAKVESDNLEYGYHDKLPSNPTLRNYSFCFDKEKHCALWVAYPLHSCYLGDVGRKDDWNYNPYYVEDVYEPTLFNAYYPQGGSSYSHSRGHQLPSADRTVSREDNLTTFYFTNATPQLQSFNSGSWASLEDALRNKWICSDTLYVVTGAHFADGYDYAYDNKGAGKACAVPTHYYKVVLRTKSGNSGKWVGDCSADELQCAGFWFEHNGGAERQTMSVEEIEEKTGFTFFPNVPNAPKSTYNASDWQ